MAKRKKPKKKFSLKKEYQNSLNFLKESKKFIWIVIGIFLAFALIGFFIPVPDVISKQIFEFIKEILGKKECSIATSKGRRLFLRNTDRFLWATDSMMGGKTGYTGEAQHCFVGAMQTDDGPIFTAVMGTASRTNLWRSTALLFSLGTGPQSIPAIKMTQGKEVKLKKGHKVRSLSKQRHGIRAIRLARK